MNTTHLTFYAPALQARTAAGGTSDAARALTASPLEARQEEFADVLVRKHERAGGGKLSGSEARDAAADFVAAAFIEPLLKQLRSTTTSAPPFAPGPGEQQFRGLMDAQLSRRIAHAAHFPLVDRVAQDLLRKPRSVPAEVGTPATAPLPSAGGAPNV